MGGQDRRVAVSSVTETRTRVRELPAVTISRQGRDGTLTDAFMAEQPDQRDDIDRLGHPLERRHGGRNPSKKFWGRRPGGYEATMDVNEVGGTIVPVEHGIADGRGAGVRGSAVADQRAAALRSSTECRSRGSLGLVD
jgi:hypothetical protein